MTPDPLGEQLQRRGGRSAQAFQGPAEGQLSEEQEGFGEQEGLTQRRVGRLPQGHLRRKGKWGPQFLLERPPKKVAVGPALHWIRLDPEGPSEVVELGGEEGRGAGGADPRASVPAELMREQRQGLRVVRCCWVETACH